MKKILLIVGIVLVLLVPIVIAVQGQDDYFVLMLVCGGTYDSANLHVGQFDSEGSAKAWADAEMQGTWDIAYIYDSWQTNGNTHLLWARSESSCYPDMAEWREFD